MEGEEGNFFLLFFWRNSMNLDQLFPDVLLMTPEEEQIFSDLYFSKRNQDLISEGRFADKTPRIKKTATPKVNLTEEEIVMMKMLGLKAKDLNSLMTSAIDDDSEDDEDDELEVDE